MQPALRGLRQILGGRRLGPTNDDQVIAGQVSLKQAWVLGLVNLEPEVRHQRARPGGDLVRKMARPAAIEIEHLGHLDPPLMTETPFAANPPRVASTRP